MNGVHLGRRTQAQTLYGLTMPLLTTSDGRKMGKSTNDAVWLNADGRNPFDYWQFWRNVHDHEVGRFFALFAKLPMDEVHRLAELKGAEFDDGKVVPSRKGRCA
ncbi:hypothetical protein [Pseudoduganella sp. RAF53_2]|uniref:hypothetical protein n=1 Tax=Pseudoduganella sp. RAF53_2 TaxID=3233060 RepID=UPI003F9D6F23